MKLSLKTGVVVAASVITVTLPGFYFLYSSVTEDYLRSATTRLEKEAYDKIQNETAKSTADLAGISNSPQAATHLLNTLLARDSLPNNKHLLVTSRGQLVLDDKWQQRSGQHQEYANSAGGRALFSAVKTTESGKRLLLDGELYVLLSPKVDGVEWQYHQFVPVADVLAPINSLFAKVAAFIAGVVLFVSFVSAYTLRRLITKPVRQLANIAEKYGTGDYSQRVSMAEDDELGALGKIFAQMGERLQSDHRLIVRNEQRYRDVVDRVKEVIFQLDEQGRLIFLSPSWESISGYPVQSALGRHLWDFLDYRDRDRKQREFLAIISGELALPCSGEYRLQTSSQGVIWVEIFVQSDPKSESVFTGSLDDITQRIQDQSLEDTYRMLGEMALRGSGTASMLELAVMRLGEIFSCGVIAAQWTGDQCVRASDETYLPPLESHISHLSLKDFSSPGSLRFSGDSLPPTMMEMARQEYGVESVLVAPISIGHDSMGRFIFLSRKADAFESNTGLAMRMAMDRIRMLLKADHDQQWMQLIGSALETAANAVLITRADSVIVWANAALTQLSGYSREEMLGKTPKLFNSQEHPPIFWQHFWMTVNAGKSWRHEVINKHKNGQLYPIRQTVTPIQNARGEVTHFISVQEDIRQEKASEDQLRHSATHDLLTGLPNRMLMHEHLQHAMSTAQRGSHVVGVLFIDLDQFKIINDSLGHQVGDELLCQVSARLAACLRVGDTLARLGGDEFVVVLPDINTPLDAAVVAEKMLQSLSTPITINAHDLPTGCSIGISVFPLDGEDADTILKNADTAMYTAKENGRNNYRFFVPDMNARVVTRMELEKDLRRALSQNEFELYYQPQLEIRSGKIIGVESLLRWKHPTKGLISPVDFITVAEETGLIVPIGEWALMTACRQLAYWRKSGFPEFTVAVNVSARQFRQEAILYAAEKALRESGVPAHMVELEITESMMLDHAENNTAILNKLHDMGFQLALDDFGTGFSSLGYLKRLPFHVLKIDRTFVHDIGLNDDDTAIAVSIIGLAHNLGMKAIAEGVETSAQRDFLKKHKCDFEQGFLFSPAITANALERLLNNLDKVA